MEVNEEASLEFDENMQTANERELEGVKEHLENLCKRQYEVSNQVYSIIQENDQEDMSKDISKEWNNSSVSGSGVLLKNSFHKQSVEIIKNKVIHKY